MTRLRHMIPVLLILCGVRQALTAASQDPLLPLHALGERARKKVEALLQDHTLKRSPRLEHPIISRALHQFLLDRPDVGAAIARILGIAKYTVTRVRQDLFHGSDGEGKAQRVVQQVSEVMAQDPQKTYSWIAESDALAFEDLIILRKSMKLPEPSATRGEPS
ncbi:MAG: hypothetical protein ACE5I9_11335 [Candidatus Methylomirabilales bacterium]